MIDPKAEPIGHRNPYKPIDVSGRRPAPEPPKDPGYESWLSYFRRHTPLPEGKWRKLGE